MDTPEIIYKYRDWKNVYHKRILNENELFFTSSKKFNDPFDCKITPNYKILENEEKKINYINSELQQLVKIGELEESEIHIQFKKRESIFHDFDSCIEGFEKNDLDFINRYYGVASFSKLWNSILMWSHYGNCHKGFCVGFNEQKFRESKKYLHGGIVKYSNKFPNIEPINKYLTESVLKVTHSKAKRWNYEKEYRVVKLIKEESDRKDVFPISFIKEIVLGSEISETDKNDIKLFSDNNNIPLYQTYKAKRKFKLKRIRIK